jgi:hypothetical protein
MRTELKRIIISTVVITIAVIVAIVALIAAIDIHCANDSYYWMPVYPDAVLLETTEQSYFRVRGMGVSEQTYLSEDSPTQVREWYRDYRREITTGLYNSNPDAAIESFGINNYSVVADDDGMGSIITYSTQCGQ